MGPVALEPLIALVEAQPKLAERKAALSVLEQLPDTELAAALVARVQARAQAPGFAEAGPLYLKLASVHPHCRRAVAQAVLDAAAADPEANKALVKAAKKAIG
jgi:hypothetical protein